MYPSRTRLQVRLTFGQTLGQVELWSDIPQQDEVSVQVDIWSDFGSGGTLVRHTPVG